MTAVVPATATATGSSGPAGPGRPGAPDLSRARRRATAVALGRSLATFAATLLAVVVAWDVALRLLDVSPYVGKGPADVWAFLVTVPDAAENRSELFGLLATTLGHAATGFVAGLVVAVALAAVFQLSKGVEHALMPLAMLLRSVPLVAMAPVIILVLGRSTASVAVIGGIVVLFPALVGIVFGLRAASPQMTDLVAVYGGGPWTRLRKVALPGALPELFAAVRVSVPGAVTGALLAEWLAVGGGIGGAVGGYSAAAQFSALWSAVVLVTVAALVLYNLVRVVESVVLARAGMSGRV